MDDAVQVRVFCMNERGGFALFRLEHLHDRRAIRAAGEHLLRRLSSGAAYRNCRPVSVAISLDARGISVDLGGLKLANLDDYLQKFGLQLENQQQIIKKNFCLLSRARKFALFSLLNGWRQT